MSQLFVPQIHPQKNTQMKATTIHHHPVSTTPNKNKPIIAPHSKLLTCSKSRKWDSYYDNACKRAEPPNIPARG